MVRATRETSPLTTCPSLSESASRITLLPAQVRQVRFVLLTAGTKEETDLISFMSQKVHEGFKYFNSLTGTQVIM